MVTLTAGIASPFFLPRMAIPKVAALGPTRPRGASRAQTPGWLAGTPAGGPESALVWPHVPDVNVDRRASAPLEDGVAWSRRVMTPTADC